MSHKRARVSSGSDTDPFAISDSESDSGIEIITSPLGSSTNTSKNKRLRTEEQLPRSTPPPLPASVGALETLDLMSEEAEEEEEEDDDEMEEMEVEMLLNRRDKGKGKAPQEEEEEDVEEGDPEDEDEDEVQVQQTRLDKGKGKAREETEDDDGGRDDADAAEDALQSQYIEKRRKSGNQVGIKAQAGVIEEIKLVDFMCHKIANVSFGPQMNFLIGNNGSGKSAVLTGITMALGGNAKATNRGAKASDLIRDGASQATCSVRLMNGGSEAFQPAKYGKSITIERTIRKLGSDSYAIKNEDLLAKDSKKSTLNAILDHFNLQVDNPMTVLTQDQSRQFLATSSEKDKYTFFLKGTQLAQLTGDYEILKTNCEAMESALARKQEALPEMKAKSQAATKKANDAAAITEQQAKLVQLENELAWSAVEEIESVLIKRREELSAEESTRTELDTKLANLKSTLGERKEKIAVQDEALADETRIQKKQEAEEADLSKKIRDHTTRLKQSKDIDRKTSSTISRLQARITSLNEQIATERSKMEQNTNDKRAPILAEADRLKTESSKLSAQKNDRYHTAEDATNEISNLQLELADLNDELYQEGRLVDGRQKTLNDLRSASANPYSRFGGDTQKLLDLIKKEKRWIKQPVGPLGRYIKLKVSLYGSVIESVLGDSLNGFAVEFDQDRSLLVRICREAGINRSITRLKFDPNFNLSGAEPSEDVLTIRRALEFTNELVEQILINSFHIESAALKPARADGDVFMRIRPCGVSTCFSANCYRVGGANGGSASVALTLHRGPKRLTLDTAAETRIAEAELKDAQCKLAQLQARRANLDGQIGAAERRKQDALDQAGRLGKEINDLVRKQQKCYEALRQDESSPTSLAALEDLKKEFEKELGSTVDQYQALKDSLQALGAEANPWNNRKDELASELAATKHRVQKLQSGLDDLYKKKLNDETSIAQKTTKLEAAVAKINQHREAIIELEVELEERTRDASGICDRPHVHQKRKAAKIQQDIDSLKVVLKEREKRQGGSYEDLKAEALRRKAEHDATKKIVDSLQELCNALKNALKHRQDRWVGFRDSIASNASQRFGFHLSTRGFCGRLIFNHGKNTLHLRVQTDTDTQLGTQASRQKDGRTLSGGEKSYSTVCLLLSIWEVVGCPVRCLDEFDVFMDAVNRLISVKKLVKAALESDSTQFILITPQAMGSDKWGPEVRVSRMPDPVRGDQGVLDFAPVPRGRGN